MRNDIVRVSHESQSTRERIKENKEKIKVNKTLPYLVSNVIEVKKKHNSSSSSYWIRFSFSYSISIHKAKKMKEPISISMLNVKANVLWSKLRHDKWNKTFQMYFSFEWFRFDLDLFSSCHRSRWTWRFETSWSCRKFCFFFFVLTRWIRFSGC